MPQNLCEKVNLQCVCTAFGWCKHAPIRESGGHLCRQCDVRPCRAGQCSHHLYDAFRRPVSSLFHGCAPRAPRARSRKSIACVSFLESYRLARLPCDTEPCAQSLSNKVHSAGRQQARSISFPICPHLEPRGTRCCLQCWRKGHTHARTRHGR